MQFQFHCECGKELVADSGQAGLTVSCPCGQSVEVPTWIAPRTRSKNDTPTGFGLTTFGWIFVIVTAIIVLTVSALVLEASEQLGIQNPRGSKRFALLMVGGTVWLYRPKRHKTAWRGKSRVIAIGPRAQEVLKRFFTPDLNDYLFSPRRAVEEFRAARLANRKTRFFPSQLRRNEKNRVKNPQRKPAEVYDVNAYGHAIGRACDRAFPPPAALAPKKKGGGRVESEREWWGRLDEQQRREVKVWRKTHRWHPNQLRHTFATAVRKEHGLEAAQVMLGHSRADVTQVYAERNEQLAATVAAKIG